MLFDGHITSKYTSNFSIACPNVDRIFSQVCRDPEYAHLKSPPPWRWLTLLLITPWGGRPSFTLGFTPRQLRLTLFPQPFYPPERLEKCGFSGCKVLATRFSEFPMGTLPPVFLSPLRHLAVSGKSLTTFLGPPYTPPRRLMSLQQDPGRDPFTCIPCAISKFRIDYQRSCVFSFLAPNDKDIFPLPTSTGYLNLGNASILGYAFSFYIIVSFHTLAFFGK